MGGIKPHQRSAKGQVAFAPASGVCQGSGEPGAWGVSATELPTDYTYTGQREAAEIGLKYYVVRWYDSEIGHFIQADTIIPDQNIPLAFNRFAYVKYNPLNLIDPSGHDDGDEEKPKSKKDIIDEWLSNPCSRDVQFCLLNSGGLIDNSHYNSTEADRFVEWLLNGYENNQGIDYYTFVQAGLYYYIEIEFGLDFSTIDSYEMLFQAGGGIWLSAQQTFEFLQSVMYPVVGTFFTSFAFSDIPSTYLAYMGAVRKKSYNEVIDILGGGIGFDLDIALMYTITGPRNSTSSMINVVDGSYIDYPSELNITPLTDPEIWWRSGKTKIHIPIFE